MNEDRANEAPRPLSQVELAAYLSVVAIVALFIGLSFESAVRQSLPGAIAGLLLAPLMLSLAFRRINAQRPSNSISLPGNLCLASVTVSGLVTFLANILFYQVGQPLPSSQGITSITIAVLLWITVALLALYTLALGATLFITLAESLLRNAPDRQPDG